MSERMEEDPRMAQVTAAEGRAVDVSRRVTERDPAGVVASIAMQRGHDLLDGERARMTSPPKDSLTV
jgi:hypothetical protein